MKKLSAIAAGALGLLIGGTAIAVTYLGHRLAGLPYLPFDVFDWMARTLPGGLIARSIDAMVGVIRGLRL
ncbi:MAG TPA: molybdopterin-binding oxidoreductase, partial [Acidobacteriota bacterium]|nr:molybdopterin-binding oxidoreductase [Acidobacteriota bacterium]